MQARRRFGHSGYSGVAYQENSPTATFTVNYYQGEQFDNSTDFGKSDIGELETMSCRDRTNEFMSTVKSMQSRQVRSYKN